jgi:hypothetical protein
MFDNWRQRSKHGFISGQVLGRLGSLAFEWSRLALRTENDTPCIEIVHLFSTAGIKKYRWSTSSREILWKAEMRIVEGKE